MKRLYTRLALIALSTMPFFLHAQDDLSSWKETYHEILAQSDQKALAMLQDRYNVLPPGIEKLYISSKIHAFMTLRGQPYYGNKFTYHSEYSEIEQTFIKALNQEEALNYNAAKTAYLSLLKSSMISQQVEGQVLFEYQLCRLLNRQGQFLQARLYCSSLNDHVKSHDFSILPRYKALRVIANNFEYSGDYHSALIAYQDYLATIPAYADPSGVYNDAGLLLKNIGNIELAKEYLNIAIKLRDNGASQLELAQSHHSMGEILLSDKDYQGAIYHFKRTEDILHPFGYTYGLTYAYLGLGRANIELGNFGVGNRYLLDALEKASEQKNDHIRGEVYLTLAKSHQLQNNFILAEDFANNASRLAEVIHSAPLRGMALQRLADIAEQRGQFQKALRYYQEYFDSELDKRNKQNQSAYLALDNERQNYTEQLQRTQLIEKNQQQSEEINRLVAFKEFLYFVIVVLVLVLYGSFYFKRKAMSYAEKDLLTGAWNRAAAIRNIRKLPRTDAPNLHYVVILLDLDDFKRINDTYGHPTGDLALTHLAEIVKAHSSQDDIFGRLGGEEFVIVLKNIDELDVKERVENLHRTIGSLTFEAENHEKLSITASFSYLSTPKSLADFDELYSILDQALYQVKMNGKNSTIDAFNEPIILPTTAYASVQP